jgi:predicted DNA-binding protein YlxM (UPF0122 family)
MHKIKRRRPKLMTLAEYMDWHSLSLNDVAEGVGVSKMTVKNIMLGSDTSNTIAKKIEIYTHKSVTRDMLLPPAEREKLIKRSDMISVSHPLPDCLYENGVQATLSYEHQQNEHQKNNEVAST